MHDFNEYDFLVIENSISDTREQLADVVRYFRSKEYHDHAMELFILKYRKLDASVIEESDCFCIDEDLPVNAVPQWMHAASLGIIRKSDFVMAGRCVFPVKTVDGEVMGLIGWDPTTTPKYIDSHNYGYKAKFSTLYGMERLPDYYRDDKPVFFTEGLMCTWYLRSKGFNALATLGSHLTSYQIQIIKRFGRRGVVVVDNDEAGQSFAKQVKRVLPQTQIVTCRYGKDIEGCRKVEDFKYEQDLLKDLSQISNPFYMPKILCRR